ncbi:MAG: hypothetical protein WDO71_26050 [Bacteroidota bacterium]
MGHKERLNSGEDAVVNILKGEEVGCDSVNIQGCKMTGRLWRKGIPTATKKIMLSAGFLLNLKKHYNGK